ncbi:MAG: heme iron utilization protein [Rhodospirillaceae bacterium]|jgi:heme iron utilization protein|nr:heme iron utilization protein [Rhodospirillaceae bacterium]MBT5244948.1 heme iron utilization protein [Rhodospirillaceae bacterium]MBT5562661.1 heme iron utilization protein [Rhodospirillaceae bacterium]MBT6243029.1 heme iron utilization protein [Rhodospirillaceae bacterium]MBT7137157.1 heme iron utilization protein [Rhodospirillaceae bacterium]
MKKDETPDIQVISRALVRRCRSATLASALTGRRQGWPYASLVTVACMSDSSPVLLLSTLADHTRNLLEDCRSALLFEEASGLANPQTGPRVTLTGRIKPTNDPVAARRFLARHPEAERYAGFADFGIYRMKVERAHYVGGFGKANWMGAKKFLFDAKASGNVMAVEQRLIERLNQEYGETLSDMVGKPGKQWRIGGVDPEGLDLISTKAFRRLDFLQSVRSGRGVHGEMAKLANKMKKF